jgi:hypothetical protein
MTANVQMGRRLVPLEHIALIEPFDPSTQPQLRSERPFQARVGFDQSGQHSDGGGGCDVRGTARVSDARR